MKLEHLNKTDQLARVDLSAVPKKLKQVWLVLDMTNESAPSVTWEVRGECDRGVEDSFRKGKVYEWPLRVAPSAKAANELMAKLAPLVESIVRFRAEYREKAPEVRDARLAIYDEIVRFEEAIGVCDMFRYMSVNDFRAMQPAHHDVTRQQALAWGQDRSVAFDPVEFHRGA